MKTKLRSVSRKPIFKSSDRKRFGPMPQSIKPETEPCWTSSALPLLPLASEMSRVRDRSSATEDSPADPNVGSSFSNSRLEIVAHSHGKHGERHTGALPERDAKLPKSAKHRPNLRLVIDQRRHSHQSDRPQSRK